MDLRDLAYRLYERRLEASLHGKAIPKHVGRHVRRQSPLGADGRA